MTGLSPDHIFSRIHRRYDRLNRVLSCGRDQAWRKRGVDCLPEGLILDLGGGTGVATPLFGSRRQVVALDPAWAMLAANPCTLRVVGKGESLPFAGNTFDGIFSAFVFRNLQSVEATVWEGFRVLRPGGTMVVVDAGRPIGRLARAVHRLGTALFSPVVGVLAGAVREYWYFHRSMDKLPHPEEMFAECPLTVDRLWRMGIMGGVYGVVLRKPPHSPSPSQPRSPASPS